MKGSRSGPSAGGLLRKYGRPFRRLSHLRSGAVEAGGRAALALAVVGRRKHDDVDLSALSGARRHLAWQRPRRRSRVDKQLKPAIAYSGARL